MENSTLAFLILLSILISISLTLEDILPRRSVIHRPAALSKNVTSAYDFKLNRVSEMFVHKELSKIEH